MRKSRRREFKDKRVEETKGKTSISVQIQKVIFLTFSWGLISFIC